MLSKKKNGQPIVQGIRTRRGLPSDRPCRYPGCTQHVRDSLCFYCADHLANQRVKPCKREGCQELAFRNQDYCSHRCRWMATGAKVYDPPAIPPTPPDQFFSLIGDLSHSLLTTDR